ncbi:MAG: NUDIX domain-containing protein [Chitinophagaceae bacterium]|nr:NUDIX domain-containing protein [Chitinophagaceae bacterium]MBL0057016.1 NUDIX domain-containing protein [Chitinophagaceae bacterium]
MYIKIYFGDKPVYLCDEINQELNELMHHPDSVFVDEISTPAINSLLHEIRKEEFHAGILWHPDLEKLKKAFFKHFTLIEAAGGIVQNDKKELLFILRLGKWDLPKGKIEKKEKADECALREVTEETGIGKLKLKKLIGETWHAYDQFGKHFLKRSHWYYMTCEGRQTPKAQAEEHITEVKWFSTMHIKDPIANTYPAIKDILMVFFDEP